MITHEIINKKDKIETQYPVERYYPSNNTPTRKIINNQNEYNERVLNNIDYMDGDYVVWKSVMDGFAMIHSIAYVRYVETDYNNIKQWSAGGLPNGVHLIELQPAALHYHGPISYFQWVGGAAWRKLVPEEYNRLINDNVRDYVKTRLESFNGK